MGSWCTTAYAFRRGACLQRGNSPVNPGDRYAGLASAHCSVAVRLYLGTEISSWCARVMAAAMHVQPGLEFECPPTSWFYHLVEMIGCIGFNTRSEEWLNNPHQWSYLFIIFIIDDSILITLWYISDRWCLVWSDQVTTTLGHNHSLLRSGQKHDRLLVDKSADRHVNYILSTRGPVYHARLYVVVNTSCACICLWHNCTPMPLSRR